MYGRTARRKVDNCRFLCMFVARMEQLFITQDLAEGLRYFLREGCYDRVFVLTDEHTERYCMPLLRSVWNGAEFVVGGTEFTSIVVGAGDVSKELPTLERVWRVLSENGATRRSLLINLGGGMVTDLGGFAAATFKRGIRFLHIPTTLLGMVDAAVGGKTGINFNGLKNEIGAFQPDWQVLIYTPFLRTLDAENLTSGYAEMIKHGLISTREHWRELLQFPLHEAATNLDTLSDLVARSNRVKEDIVAQDPFEKGLRKALNLGHTVGHAFESLSFEQQRPALHGYAVAWGVVCELFLSAALTGFPTEVLHQTVCFVREHWGKYPVECTDYDRLYELMTHDKKNTDGFINFTLLRDVGDIVLDQTASRELIFESLDFYRES